MEMRGIHDLGIMPTTDQCLPGLRCQEHLGLLYAERVSHGLKSSFGVCKRSCPKNFCIPCISELPNGAGKSAAQFLCQSCGLCFTRGTYLYNLLLRLRHRFDIIELPELLDLRGEGGWADMIRMGRTVIEERDPSQNFALVAGDTIISYKHMVGLYSLAKA